MSVLAVSTKETKDVLVVSVSGTIDASSTGELDSVLEHAVQHGPWGIVIDMSGVGFVNSAGWGMLLEKAERIVAAGGVFLLAAMQEDVEEIYMLLGLSRVIGHASSLEEALGIAEKHRLTC